MTEHRRLKLAQRQLMLAQIARREARVALAGALKEEQRSEEVGQRSQTLLREYSRRAANSDSHSLQANFAFIGSLRGMTEQAEGARKDAQDQVQWQLRTLAAAETRASRHEERVADTAHALEARRNRREAGDHIGNTAGLARKLQNTSQKGPGLAEIESAPFRATSKPRTKC